MISMIPTDLILGAADDGIVTKANTLISDFTSLVIAVAGALIAWFIISVLVKQRTFVAVAGAVAIGVFVYWMLALDGVATIAKLVKSEIDAAPVVRVVEPPQTPGVVL